MNNTPHSVDGASNASTFQLLGSVAEIALAPDLKTALRITRNISAASGCSLAVFRINDRGLELLLGSLSGDPWSRLPPTLAVVPTALERLRNAPLGTWTVVPQEDAEIPELAGHHALALHAEGKAVGFLLVASRPVGEAELLTQLLAANIGARIRVARDALELRRRRDERYEQLVQLETVAATGMLSAGVAHELNNPLGVVLGLAEILMLDEELPERIRADARVMAEATTRAVSVVRQLLSYGRGGGLDLEPAELIELVESCVRLFEASHSDPPIEVTRHYGVGPFIVLCDSFRLQQAFLAILDNAAKAVLPMRYPPCVTVSVSANDSGNIAVRFTDNGPGVEPGIRARIFDPFFTTRELGSGTGMGLALVLRTVMDHQGEVRFDEAPGGGASFVIEMDRYEA